MNRKIASAIIVTLLVVVAVSLYLYLGSSEGLVVPDNYSTIQSAVDAASTNDVIHVKSGTYNENLAIDKQITLIGENRGNTIITTNTEQPTITITATNVTVTGFTIKGTNTGIYITAENCTLTNNIIEGCGKGIHAQKDTNQFFHYINIKNNTITNNTEDGILFDGEGTPFMFNVTGNTLTSNNFGIRTVDSYRCLIQNNTIYGNTIGIDAAGTRLDIMNNTLNENTETAIKVHNPPTESSDLVKIFYNNIQNSKQGVAILQSGRKYIMQNNINNCTTALSFTQSSFNQNSVDRNNITDNTTGISIIQSNTDIYRISENNFIDNNQHFVIIDANSTIIDWDNQEKGNYWSDYTTRYPNATEIDNTGVWNIPYIIDENQQDNYPLINPIIIDS